MYPAAEVLGCRSCIRACIRSRLLPRTRGLYYTYSKRHDLDVTFMFPVPRAPRGAWKPALSDAADLYHPGGILSLGNSVFCKRSQATLAPGGSISIVYRTAQKYALQEDHVSVFPGGWLCKCFVHLLLKRECQSLCPQNAHQCETWFKSELSLKAITCVCAYRGG